MNRLKGALACAVTVTSALLAIPASAQDTTTWQDVRKAGVLRCGIATSPPYTLRDPKTNEYGGVFADVCRNFGEKVLKVKVEFVDTNWDNIVAGLQSGKWDLSLSLNDTPERRKAISFSQGAVDYSVNLTYNKNNPKLATVPQTLADIDKPNISVAVMSGTVQDKAISSVLKHAQILRLPGFDETRLALMAKRADLLADDSGTNALLTAAHPDWAQTFQPTPPLAQQSICFGVRKETPQADIDVLNRYLADLIKSGEMDRLVKASVKLSLAQSK
jgi:polar amino acid transport system substrate-binding protein